MSRDEIRWVAVASYPARYVAEIPMQALQGQGIPVLLKGEEPGIWGPAFSGPTSQGIQILVPEPAAADAREILDALGTDDGAEGEWDDSWEEGEG